jgi:CspA family cold shock protein
MRPKKAEMFINYVQKGDQMASGKVKWYEKSAGYGFIAPDDGSEELFVHYSFIANENLRVLTQHQNVTFEVKNGPKGPLAVNVQT